MTSGDHQNVAIIGGGLAGLTFALCLHRQSIPCTIYELRSPSTSNEGGALMLSPNSLRILDTLGLYTRLKTLGYNFETVTYKDENDTTTDVWHLGSESLYDYPALRIYRSVLLSELRSAVEARSVPIIYGKRFSHIVSEESSAVTFAFTDETTASASLLIGADGIHSTVRRHIAPSIVPKYLGTMAITCAVPRSPLPIPPSYPLPVSLSGPSGQFVLAPQLPNGSELLAGTQRAYPEQDRKGWDALLADKVHLLEMLQQHLETWPNEIVRAVLNNVPLETLNVWAFYAIPKFGAWATERGGVVILGDAAHAIPPTAGQGANQALEDVYSLSLLLGRMSAKQSQGEIWQEALEWWKSYRQERIDAVLELTRKLNNKRLPKAEREALPEGEVWKEEGLGEGGKGQLHWLFCPEIEEAVEKWWKSRQT